MKRAVVNGKVNIYSLTAYPGVYVAVFFLLFVSIAVVSGYIYFKHQVAVAKKKVSAELSLIADAKAAQVKNWYMGCMGQAQFIYESQDFFNHGRAYREMPSSYNAKRNILSLMDSARKNFQYSRVIFADDDLRVLLATPNREEWLGPRARLIAKKALEHGKIAVSDLHKSKLYPGTIDMDIIIPLVPRDDIYRSRRKAIGVILLEIRPGEFLYPLIQSWPTRSGTAEVLLVRREKNEVVFLNELRHKSQTALSLRLPIHDKSNVPAVQAVLGKEGITEGKDYRGVPVLAVTLPIIGTPWFMVAKVDNDEIYGPLRKDAITAGVIVFILFLSSAFLLVIIRRNRDIAERKRDEERIRIINADLERRVMERTKQLEEANREMEAFSYSVSHDLRAPLRSIDGFSSAIMEDYDKLLDEKGKSYIARVRAATGRMGLLIDDLLGLSRVTRSAMEFSCVDLSAIAREIVAEMQERSPERCVEWKITSQAVVWGDVRLLEILMRNLLENAFKFTSKQPAGSIEFGVRIEKGRQVYFVRDNGAGFDPHYTGKLFGVFQRLHSNEEFEGTGIGLATVKRIIGRHGGNIWAQGCVDEGAVFYFTIPERLSSSVSKTMPVECNVPEDGPAYANLHGILSDGEKPPYFTGGN